MKKKNFPPTSQWTILHTPLGFTQSSLGITKVNIKSKMKSFLALFPFPGPGSSHSNAKKGQAPTHGKERR